MIQSMTAFARVQREIDAGHLCWEIRSVNHRYLDVSFRLPESFRFLEPQLRSALRNKINRGKIECQLKYQDTSANNQSMLINKGMVNALMHLSSQLASEYQLANDFSVSHMMQWPGVVQANQMDIDDLSQQILSLYTDAVDALGKVRATEGAALKAHLETRVQALNQQITLAQSIVGSIAKQTKDKLLTRLHTIRMDVSEARIEQEIALLLTRLDVTEELDRLSTHVTEVDRTLNNAALSGRRLDFLMQELNREANTLSAKSDSVQLTQCAVEMKVLIEQMREQIQNIE